MTNAVYLTTTEPYSGKSIISLGLVNLLSAKTEKIAYFKPVISGNGSQRDGRLELIRSHFRLPVAYEDMYVFPGNEVVRQLNAGNEAYLVDKIIDRFKRLQESHDFVVVEGTDFIGSTANVEYDGNITIARNLGIPAAIILKGEGKTVQEIVDVAASTTRSFNTDGVPVLTVIANRIDPGAADEVREALTKALPREVIVTCIPADTELASPTMKEIFASVGGQL